MARRTYGTSKCVEPECANQAIGRHLCDRHYRLHKRIGDLDRFPKVTLRDVFEYRTIKGPGCWAWNGWHDAFGYGIVCMPGNKQARAHRVAYALLVGPIPKDMVVMHSCDNPDCVNPAHLSLGTRADNNRDMRQKRRHAFGERNGHARLTQVDIDTIRSSAKKQAELAREYKVSQSHISRIKSGDVWNPGGGRTHH